MTQKNTRFEKSLSDGRDFYFFKKTRKQSNEEGKADTSHFIEMIYKISLIVKKYNMG
jgi:hypothetical protein